MSGTTRSSADLDVRRRRILFRSWHRGIREMDLLMGQFADGLTLRVAAVVSVVLVVALNLVLLWLTFTGAAGR